AAAMDKLSTFAIANSIGIDAIPTVSFTLESDQEPPFSAPWVVKPRFGGSSIGVEVGVSNVATISSLSKLESSRSGVIVQPYLEGWIDLNMAVRRSPTLQVSAIERPFADGIYDYATKYLSGGGGMESAPRELPAHLPPAVQATIEEAARSIALALQITGAPRIDFMWDGEERVLFNEINPIPGAFGMYLWDPVGVGRGTLLHDLVAEAYQLPLHPSSWTASSDGSALRVAGNVASKLA
ncbi:MAG: hypothetical protein ACC652_12290, partial [Acidimicrobiales bacterium]